MKKLIVALLLALAAVLVIASQTDIPKNDYPILRMTQEERAARHRVEEFQRTQDRNLQRDPFDRARVVCAAHLGVDASLDWPVTKQRGNVFKVEYSTKRPACYTRRNAEMDLEVVR